MRSDGRHDQIEPDDEVGLSPTEQVRVGYLTPTQPQVTHHRPRLLGEPGLVEASDVPAVEHRGRGQDLGHGHNAGSTDPRQPHIAGIDGRARCRVGQRPPGVGVRPAQAQSALGRSGSAPRSGTTGRLIDRHGHETRAITFHAGEVEVARRLVDQCLRTEVGVDGVDGQAVAHLAAITAGLADPVVHRHPETGCGNEAPFAQPAGLSGAGLVVDEKGHPGDRRQVPLGLDDPGPVPDPEPACRYDRSADRPPCRHPRRRW